MGQHGKFDGRHTRSRCRQRSKWLAAAVVAGFGVVAPNPALRAQVPAEPIDDSEIPVFHHDDLVVTAERTDVPVAQSSSAVSVLTGVELRRMPARTLADALRQIPGITYLDFDGSGRDPQAVIRGHYGGGEAEYLLVLVDGIPVNRLRDGRINWDLIPLSAIESIEVVRGASSSVWGDVAQAGVVNIITRQDAGTFRFRLAGDALDGLEGAGRISGNVAGRAASLWMNGGRSGGYRDHSARRDLSGGASISLANGEDFAAGLSLLHHWRQFEDPGPIAGDSPETRETSLPYFRYDETQDRLHRVAVNAAGRLSAATRASGHIAFEVTDADIVRTLPLAPDFFDTQARDVSGSRLFGSVQLEASPAGLPASGRISVGADVSVGRLESEYRGVITGGAEEYAQGNAKPGELRAAGEGNRSTAAAFLRYEARPHDRVRVVVGGRFDWLQDAFDPRSPGEGERLETSHTAFSPEIGANFWVLDRPDHQSHVYANLVRSFKAPTLDQLFDQRAMPAPFPPFQITISNHQLDPQRGMGGEVGLYHRSWLAGGALGAELSLAAYQMDIEDEIDFSVEEFAYVNIGESRHRGVEAGLKLRTPAGAETFLNYSRQNVTVRAGEYAGKSLKAIPRYDMTLGASSELFAGVGLGVIVRRAGPAYLDDANSLELPGHTRVDLRLSARVRGVGLEADALNLFNREYYSTGYPDPAGTDLVYYFPAARRVLRIQLHWDR